MPLFWATIWPLTSSNLTLNPCNKITEPHKQNNTKGAISVITATPKSSNPTQTIPKDYSARFSTTTAMCVQMLEIWSFLNELDLARNPWTLKIVRRGLNTCKGVFSWWKILAFGTVAHFVVTWQIMFNYGLIKLKRFSSCYSIRLCN